jgi:F-type H+-transporting ATPase subunit b
MVLLVLGALAAVAWGADTSSPPPAGDETSLASLVLYLKTHFSRATWDLIMRWVNFLILAAVIIKYARTPVIDFLKGKRAETARVIEEIEEKKRSAEEKIKARQIELQASKERLKLIQDRIISEGQRQKEKMIADAQKESRMMLETAHTKVSGQIRDAHHAIRSELIETATEKALERMPQMMTEEDHDQMVRLWFEQSGR